MGVSSLIFVGMDGQIETIMVNMTMMVMEMKTMMIAMIMRMMSLSLKTLPYHQGMHLV